MKDPVEIQPPGGDFLLVVLCVEMSRNYISFALFDDILLDLRYSSEIRSKIPSMSYSSGCHRCTSHRQLLDRLTHRVVKFVQPLPSQPPVQGSADFGAGQPKFDVIYLVGHRVLGAFQSAFAQQTIRRRLTLIIVRITLTDPKAALAGVILESSFARFMASIAAFNVEIMPSRPLGRWGSASMVETRSGCEESVRREGYKESSEPW